MSDEGIEALLDSDAPLVVIEAPAGCGKTYQGSKYAQRSLDAIGSGRLLILTHTHAACSVFAERTKSGGSKVEIRTIDALIAQIASAYHKTLGLPPNPSAWAWRDNGRGFEIMAASVAKLLAHQPVIASVLAERYPIVICDEHQDSSSDQHAVVMAINAAGARLRIFGDPMQSLFGGKTDKAVAAGRARWDSLKRQGKYAELREPQRWKTTAPKLGTWVLDARTLLRNGEAIDLTGTLPLGLNVLYAGSTSPAPKVIQIPKDEREPIDKLVDSSGQIMVLGGNNDTVAALHAFWGRRIPIWEGHSREALALLADACATHAGAPEAIASAFTSFVSAVAKGFSLSSHGDRLLEEVRNGCSRRTTGKPENIRDLGRLVLENPTHVGISAALRRLECLITERADGFDQVAVNHRREFRDAIRLADYADPQEGYGDLARRRSYAHPMPPSRVLSTIHKAKGLECDNVIVMGCDKKRFSSTDYARCKMYVALSRAMKSLTLVVSRDNPSPLFKISPAVGREVCASQEPGMDADKLGAQNG